MDVVRRNTETTVEVEAGVFLTQLAAGDRLSIQHVRLEPDARVPMHSHPHEQGGFVYQGSLTFELESGETIRVDPGESYRLAGDEPHAAVNHGPDTALAIDIFSPPRANPNWLDG